MERTKTSFRAIREIIGLSQADVADMAGVSVTAVKRWEHPDGPEPPEDAWDELMTWLDAHRKYVAGVVDIVKSASDGLQAPSRVTLPYYRTQAEYDACGRDEGVYSVVNARARAIWQTLAMDGVEVDFIAPDEMGPEVETR